MDGGKKAARPAPAAEATQQPAARAALETQADVGQPDVASVDESHGAAVGYGPEEEDDHHDDDDDDDEQVERFYALLANIRAMRGLAPHNTVASSSGGDSTRAKRLRRSAEPPWRPAFRMEDFEEPLPPRPSASTSWKIRKRTTIGAGHDDDHGHGESSGGSARPPVAVVASSSMPHAAVRFQQSDSTSCSRD